MEEENYEKAYSDESFGKKVKKYAKIAGKEVLGKALTQYETLKDDDTPKWAKTVIIGALGYFISPIDAIPDLSPIIGFTDDLGALAVAYGAVLIHIKEEHKQKAEAKLERWFGGSPKEPKDK
ncbi:YkvA family protein [Akkermansiaceae bacterium]|nr:YkvA family protein [Akkermansiaceae bacterium]